METNTISPEEFFANVDQAFYDKAMQEAENDKIKSITIITKGGAKRVYTQETINELIEDHKSGAQKLTNKGIRFVETLQILFSC